MGNTQEYLGRLFKLYFFAENICMNALANKTMDCIRTCCERYPQAKTTSEMVAYVYKNTFEDSPLRTWAIHDFSYALHLENEGH